jgi:hypothetical protein
LDWSGGAFDQEIFCSAGEFQNQMTIRHGVGKLLAWLTPGRIDPAVFNAAGQTAPRKTNN